MKKFILTLALGSLLAGTMGILVIQRDILFSNDVEVIKDIETVYQVEKVDSLEIRIKEAQEEAREAIETKAQTAYEAIITDEMTAVADRVKVEYITEIEETISDEGY